MRINTRIEFLVIEVIGQRLDDMGNASSANIILGTLEVDGRLKVVVVVVVVLRKKRGGSNVVDREAW
jgi:hypothetical protein